MYPANVLREPAKPAGKEEEKCYWQFDQEASNN